MLLEPAHSDSFWDTRVAGIQDFFFNQSFIEAIRTGNLRLPLGLGLKSERLKGTVDFWGLNYYARMWVWFDLRNPFEFFGRVGNRPCARLDQINQESYPPGIYIVLKRLSDEGKPIFITETGVSTEDENWRKEFLRETLTYVHQAIKEGAPVRGFFYWSFMDNFEWADGFEPRFGLIGIDYKTQQRVIRPAALLYARICRTNRLE